MSAEAFFLVSYDSSHSLELPTNSRRSQAQGVELPLYAPVDEDGGLKVTIIIGPNGSGKSTVLASLAEELEIMAELLGRTNETSRRPRDAALTWASIEYCLDGRRVKLIRKGIQVSVLVDGHASDPDTVPFPANVLAVAHLPADKFRFERYKKDPSFYRYLGLRQATNLSTTGALETAVLASLLASRGSLEHQTALRGWLTEMGLEDEFLIEIVGIDERTLETRNLDHLASLRIRSVEAKFVRDSKLYFQESNSGINREMIDRGLARFFNQLRSAMLKFKSNSKMSSTRMTLLIPLSTLLPSEPGEPVSLQVGFDFLRKMNLARAINLIVIKKGQQTPFSQLSSGERQMLGTATRLIEHAANGSVILIDEPEVSLHPTWQIAYVPRLLQALGHLRAAHVIIATHSHFMVSDVGKAASLTVAAQDNFRKFERFEEGVYGRTPENILYRVFGIGAVSNFYVEQDLANALKMISGTEPVNNSELRLMRSRLERVRGLDNPAFEEILLHIDQYLESATDA